MPKRNTGPELAPAIRSFYEHTQEDSRLDTGLGRLEALRTRQLIERHAPRPPATVLDVGGAAGVYAFWLAESGYTVHLIDAVPQHIEQARQRNQRALQPLASCEVGDARSLPFPDALASIVLLLGPLYHLTDPAERTAALKESARVLKPGGFLFAAAISRWASALDGLARDLFADPAYADVVERVLPAGLHEPYGLPYFTTAYFHKPDELHEEITDAGFMVTSVFGLEGPATVLPDLEARWADARRRADLIRIATALESEPAVLGMSAHLLAVARKPADEASGASL